MKFSKKLNYILLLILTMLNIIFRYPTTMHELGGFDSFFIHGLANSISVNGYAKWIINPLSIFGLYPYSYPSAIPYILSGVSQCTDLGMEWTIFLVGTCVGIFAIFTTYLMAREIKNDDLFAFLVAFTFSLSPVLLSLTRWCASTRGMFLSLLPLLIWGLLRYHNKNDTRYILLSAVLFVIIATIHRAAWLIIPVFFAYFIAVTIENISRKIKLSKETLLPILGILLLGVLIICAIMATDNLTPLLLIVFVAYFLNSIFQKIDKKLRASVIISLILILLFICSFIMQFSEMSIYKTSDIWYNYQAGYFFEGSEWYILILNMLTNYTGQIGILIFFGIIGIFVLLLKSKKDFNYWFILLSILFLISLSALGTYVPIVLLPFFSVLIGIGLCKILNITQMRKYGIPIIMCCLLISLSFSGFMINHWENIPLGKTNLTPLMEDETYSAAIFLKDYGHGTFVSSDSIISYRISAYSETPLFPGHSAWPLAYSFIDNPEIVSMTEFTLNLDYLYVANNTVQKDYNVSLTFDCDNTTAKELLSKYNIHYYIENNNMQPQDQFFKSVREKRYKIYDDGVESIWYLGVGV